MRRRTLFKWLVGGASIAMGSMVVVPALISALSPAHSGSSAWRVIGPLGRFMVGRVVKARIPQPGGAKSAKSAHAREVYVWVRADSDVVVFSPLCTDLGCSVNFDPGSEFYYCPCHGGIFSKVGEPVAGPPVRPLYRYATRVRAGVLEIDLRSVPVVA
jgi:menaquinol-cytochrome c reductase iron-sulfur subunit